MFSTSLDLNQKIMVLTRQIAQNSTHFHQQALLVYLIQVILFILYWNFRAKLRLGYSHSVESANRKEGKTTGVG